MEKSPKISGTIDFFANLKFSTFFAIFQTFALNFRPLLQHFDDFYEIFDSFYISDIFDQFFLSFVYDISRFFFKKLYHSLSIQSFFFSFEHIFIHFLILCQTSKKVRKIYSSSFNHNFFFFNVNFCSFLEILFFRVYFCIDPSPLTYLSILENLNG